MHARANRVISTITLTLKEIFETVTGKELKICIFLAELYKLEV